MIAPFVRRLTPDDYNLLGRWLGSYSRIWKPDVTLAPDGPPYIFRWYLMDEKERGSVMIHMQVASDPWRPLHDHPWENSSVILSGSYIETLNSCPGQPGCHAELFDRQVGDKIDRAAAEAHRLVVPEGVPYVLTLFTTGPKIREWGFWYPDGWHHNRRHVSERSSRGQVSVHVADQGEMA